MWQPITLRIKNLFTHQDTTFDFKRNEMILLLGLNEDQEGSNSNGSGKSSIPDGLILCLTGEPYREVNKDEFIRKGENHCVVSLELLNSITKERLVIYREIYIGNKVSVLEILINDKPVKDFSNQNKMKRSAQEFIYEKLGITKESLNNYFVISEGNDSCFLTATDGKQKEVISQFSNYSKVDKIVEKIKEDLDNLEDEIVQNGQELISRVEYVVHLDEIIEELKNNKDYEDKKEMLQESIEELKDNLVTIKEKHQRAFVEMNSLSKEIVVLKKGIKSKDTLITLTKKLREIKERKEEQEETINEIKEIKSQLIVRSGKMLECPKCKWVFLPNDNITVKELEASKKHVEKELIEAQKILISNEEVIKQLKSLINSLEQVEGIQSKLNIKQSNFENYKEKSIELEEELARKNNELLTLKKTNSNEKLIKQQKLKIKEAGGEIEHLKEREEQLIKKKESLNFHLFAFSRQFRTYISNKTIRTIQDIINFYLKKFNVSMQIMINGYTILRNQEVREKIQIWVIKDGKNRVLFKALSTGERARISLCSIIALNRLFRNSAENGGLDLIFIDELLTGLDARGSEEVIKILEQSKLTSVIVMHHIDDIHCRNKIIVNKKNGISKIIQN